MYRELEAQIARCGINRKVLAQKINIPYSTFIGKINGNYAFTFDECLAIKSALGYEESLDLLFKKTKKHGND